MNEETFLVPLEETQANEAYKCYSLLYQTARYYFCRGCQHCIVKKDAGVVAVEVAVAVFISNKIPGK